VNFLKSTGFVSEETASSVRTPQIFQKGGTIFRFVFVSTSRANSRAGKSVFFLFLIAMGKLALFAVSTRAYFNPVFADLSLVFGFVDAPLSDDLTGCFTFA
jgi:hypothetical protein